MICNVCQAIYPESWGLAHCDHSDPKKDFTKPKRKAEHTSQKEGYRRRPSPNLWTEIHAYLADAIKTSRQWDPDTERQRYISTWVPRIPSYGCSCSDHWRELTSQKQIDWSTARAAFDSFWDLHNTVSEKHSNKPTISLAEAEGLYQIPVVRKPRLIITVAAGKHLKFLDELRPYFQLYAKKTNADYVEITNDMRPEFQMANKYRMTSYGWHYDQTLMIDCDVLIKPDSPDIFDHKAFFAGVDERPIYEKPDWFHEEAREVLESQARAFRVPSSCINAGVMLASNEGLKCYYEPHNPYPSYWCGEQYWLWDNLEGTQGVKLLDEKWNWCYLREQTRPGTFWPGTKDAHFIHLNNLFNQPEKRLEVLLKLKEMYPIEPLASDP